jgi:hypothetical protein
MGFNAIEWRHLWWPSRSLFAERLRGTLNQRWPGRTRPNKSASQARWASSAGRVVDFADGTYEHSRCRVGPQARSGPG